MELPFENNETKPLLLSFWKQNRFTGNLASS